MTNTLIGDHVCKILADPVVVVGMTNDEQHHGPVRQAKVLSFDADDVIYGGHLNTAKSIAWSPVCKLFDSMAANFDNYMM